MAYAVRILAVSPPSQADPLEGAEVPTEEQAELVVELPTHSQQANPVEAGLQVELAADVQQAIPEEADLKVVSALLCLQLPFLQHLPSSRVCEHGCAPRGPTLRAHRSKPHNLIKGCNNQECEFYNVE